MSVCALYGNGTHVLLGTVHRVLVTVHRLLGVVFYGNDIHVVHRVLLGVVLCFYLFGKCP